MIGLGSDKKDAKLQRMGCDSIQQCNYIQMAFGVKQNYSKKSFLNRPHISIASTGKCMRHIVVIVLFAINVSGDGDSPLPPASAYITV